jgi:hypothetical protein
MKTTIFYFVVELPETGMALTWIGGGLKPSKRPDRVWLTTPDGRPVLEAPQSQVHPSSPEDLAQRILEERRLAKAPLN